MLKALWEWKSQGEILCDLSRPHGFVVNQYNSGVFLHFPLNKKSWPKPLFFPYNSGVFFLKSI